MKEILVKIKEEDSDLIKQLLEKLGAEISEKTPPSSEKITKRKTTAKKEKQEKNISPTFLFGKWKGLDIDARKLREAAWDRSHKSL